MLWIDTYFAHLQIHDSKGRSLIVVPRSLLDSESKEEQAVRRLRNESDVPLNILLAEPILEDRYESLRLSFITSYSTEPSRKEREPSFQMKYAFWLVGYADYAIDRESDTSYSYFEIEAPKDYELRVQADSSGEEIHRDETSYIVHGGPSVVKFQIRVPYRVTVWLLIGLLIGLANPILVSALYWVNSRQFGPLATLTAGITGLVVGFRVLLFENVGLLNRLNKWYATIFALNVITLLVLSFIFVTRPPPAV